MSHPSPSSFDPVTVFTAVLDRSVTARYGAAIGLVGLSLAFRLLIDPAITPGFGYTIFYPAVILSAYWLGSRQGLLAALLSAIIVYGFMGPEPLTLRTDARSLVSLGMFGVSSSLLIHVLGAIRSRLDGLADNHRRMEALVLSQADLFRDHAARVSDHMQLVSAILQVSALAERDDTVAQVLNNAASRTLLISRTQRAVAGEADREIDFVEFARRLVAAVQGIGRGRVSIEGPRIDLPLEQAAGLGVILLEWLNTLSPEPSDWTLRAALETEGGQRVLTLIAEGEGAIPAPRDIALVEAVTEQLGGRLMLTRAGRSCAIRIAFPSTLHPPKPWNPLGISLH